MLVTGTDTGVGKTFVTAAIAAALAARGRRVGVYKPVETGCETHDGRRIGGDCERLLRAAKGDQSAASAASYLFALPAAPLIAARAEGATIDISRIERDFAAIANAHDVTLVEGAGGLLVPIAEGVTYLELVRRLALPVLVVVGSRLGCINHALLTLGALETAGIACLGYVINCLDAAMDGPASPARNREAIGEFTRARDLGILRHLVDGDEQDGAQLVSIVRENERVSSFLDEWMG